MKKVFTMIMLVGILSTGCKKFLDVKPHGETTQDELFKTQKGFRDVLTGAYIRMKSGNIYGGSLMWGNIEYMAGNWDNTNSANTAIPALIAGKYTDQTVREWNDATYQDLYKVIADVNSILEKIDEKKAVFSDGNYAITKGESLALRAFCHFDALRMFGPVPSSPGIGLVLPYVKTVTKDTHLPISYQEFAKAVLADLDQAETLLKDVDPIRKYSIAQLNPGPLDQAVISDNYLEYRQVRMNYYAVLALKARVYLWLASSDAANKVNAAKYAQMVVDAVNQTGKPTFRLGEESDRAAQDYTMPSEHIMALSVYNLEAIANSLFGNNSGGLQRYDFADQDGFYYLNNLFPVAERTSDIRWKGQMWTYKSFTGLTSYATFKKFIQKPASSASQTLQVPLIRLSEMYLILTECADTKASAEASYLVFCSKKGIPFTAFNNADWMTDRKNKMIREYVRELYGEGQSFFTYKRYNVTTLPASWTSVYYNATPAKYIVPKPDREIN
ncbi:RagB/SusD family nutrient uptake outer membrane protein [Pedobacter miscanthi]|uniref:SusD-like N-terminal domain-containing protein n=1 Tax=Pedobacter miscanthi TaxID=2259170 RepID=A0A366L287_9SPHI|nr:RagB/SusD family nutrient uptake outer membrane protein [Pedobacter miscanthi]RBQ07900.1 hypothetical protein DRW42_09880 [Pedobacter miscanthi]